MSQNPPLLSIIAHPAARWRFFLRPAVCCLLLFWLVAGQALGARAGQSRPGQGAAPVCNDDLGFAGLLPAIRQSLILLERWPAEQSFRLCGRASTVAELRQTLVAVADLFGRAKTSRDRARLFAERFVLCPAAGRDGAGAILLTGYFEPLLAASLERRGGYQYPLYRRPPDLVSQPGPDGSQRLGRLVGGRLVPYWSRGEIEGQQLLAGQELAFLADPVDAFILHVQGSGRLRLPDGTVRRVQYAAKNGRPYRSIGRYLAEQGVMQLSEVTLPGIIDYLKEHPRERQRVLNANPSYIFFRWGDPGPGPLGAYNVPLTGGRSLALDRRWYPPGAIALVRARKPVFDRQGRVIGWQPFSRLVLHQDSGSAITGPARADLFCGSGSRAAAMAGLLKEPARLYFLLRRSP